MATEFDSPLSQYEEWNLIRARTDDQRFPRLYINLYARFDWAHWEGAQPPQAAEGWNRKKVARHTPSCNIH